MKEIHFGGRRACLSICYVFSFQATLASEVRSRALRKPQNVLTLNVIRPDDPLYARPAKGWLVMMMRRRRAGCRVDIILVNFTIFEMVHLPEGLRTGRQLRRARVTST